ncbi:unnamed protein product [Kluyveromyces dobzhanskii CBS 2104]|uniref:WGS project CCBQ000000000 data, contig 00104 n=1 Tax=Kluyveromyces dobzhanskii CBS 2104 TaxID=1427455 RepID=A0A0A8L631_9SACH|nr:unnamed protein product [Kluyveromyces dobzhanskii CBS 2104]
MRSIKCVIVGDGAVGKTSLLISYTTNTFPQDYIPTVFDNYSTTIALPDPNSRDSEPQVFKLNLWDTAGQEEYDRLRPLSYPQTDIFLICFSVNEPNSFENVHDKWFPEIKHNTNFENLDLYHQSGRLPILLIGTKADLRDDDHERDRLQESNSDFVSQQQIQELVNKLGLMGYVECSAATQAGVREVFEKAVDCVVFEPDRFAKESLQQKQDVQDSEQKPKPRQVSKKSHTATQPESSMKSPKAKRSIKRKCTIL